MKKIVATAALLLALVIVPRLISAAYMESAGVLVTGKVVAKREAFLMPGGDTERHIFEITYEYQPGDAHYRETIVQRVDASFFRRNPVGSTVRVRYSPSRVLRSFAGIGLYLEDASPLSRLHCGKGIERVINLDIALTSCPFAGLNRRFSGTFLLGVPDSSGQMNLAAFSIPVSGQKARAYHLGGTLRRR